MLGERMHPMVAQYTNIKDCRKITGMLLEQDDSDLLQLLMDKQKLKEKVAEALGVLETYQAKQMLGERLYPTVAQYSPRYCDRITGMFMELDISELLQMLEDAQNLKQKVVQALGVLWREARMATKI